MRTKMVYLCLLFVWGITLDVSAKNQLAAEQRYGQKPPGTTPELYQPKFDFLGGFRATQIIMSPKGNEMCLVVNDPNASEHYNRNTIYFTQLKDDTWTTPTLASFIPNQGNGVLPQFSLDGTRFSYSYRGDLWVSSKEDGQWTAASKFPAPITTDKYECGFSYVLGDRFYFAANGRPEGKSKQCDLYVSKQSQGIFSPPINLGSLNTPSSECVLAVDPQERYIIFTRFCRKAGNNAVDLYIGFHQNDGTWTKAKKLDQTINSPGSNHSPSLSYDGKYLFFSQTDFENRKTKQYWVSTRLFEQMLDKAL